jgi:hypothetical protein
VGVPPLVVELELLLLLPPPQPIPAARNTKIRPSNPAQRLREGTEIRRIPAAKVPPLAMNHPERPRFAALGEACACAAVVATLMVAVALVVDPLRLTDVVLPEVGAVNAQVTPAVVEGGVRAQERFTVPVKPDDELTVMVDVPEAPGEAIVTAVPLIEYDGMATNPGQAVINTFASIEPSPVTRS